jgi:CrcB protein
MKRYLLIGIFGIAGAVCRFGVGLLLNTAFPWETCIVNFAGCFLLPAIFVFIQETGICSREMVTAMGTGFVGAFTTFSSFSTDFIKLILEGKVAMACMYLSVSLVGGLIAVVVGMNLSNVAVDKWIRKEEK